VTTSNNKNHQNPDEKLNKTKSTLSSRIVDRAFDQLKRSHSLHQKDLCTPLLQQEKDTQNTHEKVPLHNASFPDLMNLVTQNKQEEQQLMEDFTKRTSQLGLHRWCKKKFSNAKDRRSKMLANIKAREQRYQY
jgi:hypothetical protein